MKNQSDHDKPIDGRKLDTNSPNEFESNVDPQVASVRSYLIYGLSVPERALRSTAAMVGGVLNESAEMLVPQAFRDSKSYKTFVEQMLKVMSEDVGGVKNHVDDSGADPAEIENYVARKTVGSFIDLAGLATLHLSPVVVLAVVSDVAYGSKVYLNELAEELKKEGVIAPDSSIDGVADLLDAIGEVSGETATAFDTPPVSIEGLKQTIQETRDKITKIDPGLVVPKSEIDQLWNDMQELANQEEVELIKLSSAITLYTLNQVDAVSRGALTTIGVTGNLFDRHILQYYRDGINEISNKGFYAVIAESSQPYIEAVWENFSMERPTVTEDIMSGKLVKRVRNWIDFRGKEK